MAFIVKREPTQSLSLNGLVLYLDSTNSNSYSGSGTVWNDLSINNFIANLNGCTFDSNTKSIITNGSSDYILTNSLISAFTSDASESIFILIYPISQGNIVTELGDVTISAGWHDSNIEIDSNGRVKFGTWAYPNGYITSDPIAFNQWYLLGFTHDQTSQTLKGYINGQLIGSISHNRSDPYNNGQQVVYGLCSPDGTNMGTNSYCQAKIKSFFVYNRALTQNEINQLS